MMVLEWIRFLAGAVCMAAGLVFYIIQFIGVFRFKYVLNRMHAAAMGDTLGILFVLLGLIVIAGPGFDALKLFLVVLFFWVASPVAGHMISRLEATTDEDLGEIEVKGHEDI